MIIQMQPKNKASDLQIGTIADLANFGVEAVRQNLSQYQNAEEVYWQNDVSPSLIQYIFHPEMESEEPKNIVKFHKKEVNENE